MAANRANRTGNSGTEEQFVQLFCEMFGAEQGEYVYLQFPFLDIYGKHRTIDYAFCCSKGRIAVEIDGMTWHAPSKVSDDKYEDDLLKQNSMTKSWRGYLKEMTTCQTEITSLMITADRWIISLPAV